MTNVYEHLDELLDVVREADEAIMEVYDAHSAVVEMKADSTPLTQADVASHHILTDGLKRLFPNVPVVSEEGDEAENQETVGMETFWLVDPIDGTKEFIARTGHFTVCAALIEDDRPSFGIISAPALGITYYGSLARGSYKRVGDDEAERIHVSPTKLGVVLGSPSGLDELTANYVAEHYPGSEVRAVGSQLKLPQIAEGSADAYPRIGGPMHLWDLAAGQAILQAAGGSVMRPDGSPIDYHAKNLLIGDFIASS